MSARPVIPHGTTGFSPIITIYNSIVIAQSPTTVLRACLDTTTWPIWNTYMPTGRIFYTPPTLPPSSQPVSLELKALFTRPNHLSPGCKLTVTHSDGTPPSNIQIDEIYDISTQNPEGKSTKGYRVVARVVDVTPWLYKVLRIQDFVETEDQGMMYQSWTELGGAGAWLAKIMGMEKRIGKLFDVTFLSLKEYVESGRGQGGGNEEVGE